jgi:hypothetical protein
MDLVNVPNAIGLAAIGTAVWAVTTRTLSSFGTLVADAATAVWAAATRTLSAFGFTVAITPPADMALNSTVAKDATVMKAVSYTAPDNADIALIKAKTDIIPALPSAVGSPMTLTSDYDAAKNAASSSALSILQGNITTILADYARRTGDYATVAALATLQGNVTTILADYARRTGDYSTYSGGDTTGTTTLLSRLTALRAGYLDLLNSFLDVAVSSRSKPSDSQTIVPPSDMALNSTVAKDATVMKSSLYTSPDNSGIAAIKAITDQFVFTIAHQVDANAVTGGEGLTAEQIRAAIGMALANLDAQLVAILDSTGGAVPTVEEIVFGMDSDSTKLSAIKERTDRLPDHPASVGSVTTVIAQPSSVTDNGTASLMKYRRGDTWNIPINNLGDISAYTSLWWTVKTDPSVADSRATLQIKKNASGINDGLICLNASSDVNSALAWIEIVDSTNGNIIIHVDQTITSQLKVANNAITYYQDFQKKIDGILTTPVSGALMVPADVTQALS